MKEDLVTFEQAKALKKLGFEWPCDKFYATQNYCIGSNAVYFDTIAVGDVIANPKYKEDKEFGWIIDEEYSVPAPTIYQAQKWVREEKGIVILIDYERYDEKESFYSYDIRYTYDNRITVGLEFSTYEEALSSGIDKALKILNQQKI